MKQVDMFEWKLQKDMKRKLNGIAGSFQRLSGSLRGFTQMGDIQEAEQLQEVFEEVSLRLCSQCEDCSRCWEKEEEESSRAVRALIEQACQEGGISEESGELFLEHCLKKSLMLQELNGGVHRLRQGRAWKNKLLESREAVAGQLTEMARIVGEFAGNLDQKGVRFWSLPRSFYLKLWMKQIHARQLMMLECRDGSLELHMTARCRKGRCMTTREASLLLSCLLGEKLIPSEDSRNVIGREYADYVFREDANFQVITGVARAPRADSRISGDSFSFLYPEGDEVIMLLADGMGSGEAACRESERVIDLLEQFLEAGFHEEAAVRLINSMLVLRTENYMLSTMDICVLHLTTGVCDFLKAGAAATFLLRKDWLESISSTTLPAGILSAVDCDTRQKKLYDGEYVIMLSDGVLDGENGEEFISEALSAVVGNNPQELANAILDAAMLRENYQPKDDMTVLVAGLFHRAPAHLP